MRDAGHHDVACGPDDAGERLDRVLAAALDGLSRSRVKALIKDGRVRQEPDGLVVDTPNRAVVEGEIFRIKIPAAEPAIPRAENIPLQVIFEDDAVIVVDKPAGMVVHPAAGNWTGTLVNALIGHCGDSLSGIGGVKRPGIVHRLDKDTSGLMVVAKTDEAHASLSAQFAAHGRDGRMTRAYEAIVWGTPHRPRGAIDAPLGRAPGNRTKMAVVRAGREAARHAVTHYETLESFDTPDRAGAVARVHCVLETGRTHQIRVHLAHLGHPLLGDTAYGAGFAASASLLGDSARNALQKLNRQALHAVHLGFEHPLSGEARAFDSPLPGRLARLVAALRGPGDESGDTLDEPKTGLNQL